MSPDSLTNKVREVIAGELGITLDDVKLTDSLRGDLSADSLEIQSILLELENALGIEIGDEQLLKLGTVQSIVDFAWERMSITA